MSVCFGFFNLLVLEHEKYYVLIQGSIYLLQKQIHPDKFGSSDNISGKFLIPFPSFFLLSYLQYSFPN